MKYGLSPQALDIAFPFHLIWDQNFVITQAGRALCRLYANIVGQPLGTFFQFKRPPIALDYRLLSSYIDSVILLDSAINGMCLKGQLLLLENGNQMLFLGSPWITNIHEVAPLALTLNDFALHDSIADYLLLLQTKETALLDTRRLAEKLQAKETRMRTMNRALEAEIAERTRIEEALALARDQALEASRLKSEFLATMSHEIRTPMNGIIGMSELLMDCELDPDAHEYAQVVNQEAETLLALINDILDFSKIEAGKLRLEERRFPLQQLVDGVTRLLQPKAEQKGLRFIAYLDAGLPAELDGDEHRLRQVLVNLVGNAVKFTEKGEVVLEIRRNRAQGDLAVAAPLVPAAGQGIPLAITVRDSGIGISKADQQKLFTLFSQADSSTTRKYGGTGLGLAITKRLVELMHGTITVQSQPGSGSTFTVWLTLTTSGMVGPQGQSTAETQPFEQSVDPFSTLHAPKEFVHA